LSNIANDASMNVINRIFYQIGTEIVKTKQKIIKIIKYVNILRGKILTCLRLEVVNNFERKGERGLGFCTEILLKVAGLPI